MHPRPDTEPESRLAGGRRVDAIIDLIDRALVEYEASQTTDIGRPAATRTTGSRSQ